MPLVFFSGGIDSAVLTFDVATRPYRYGVSVGEETELTLVTVGSPKKGERDLAPLLAALRKVSSMPIRHLVKEDGLRMKEAAPLPKGGPGVIDPFTTRYLPAIDAMPYTAGWLLWMSAVAVNELYDQTDQEYGPQQAFVAHQWNGPTWEAHDEKRVVGFDCSPEFYKALNRTIVACREMVTVRAPFVENRMNKAMVVQLGLEIGCPLEHTSSCVYGWKKVCGACAQCLIRQTTFKTLGVKHA